MPKFINTLLAATFAAVTTSAAVLPLAVSTGAVFAVSATMMPDVAFAKKGRDDRRRNRPEQIAHFSASELAGLLNGRLAAVDSRGRLLEVEVEYEHGARIVKVKPHGGDARRNPGPIGRVKVVPAANAPKHW